MVSSLLLGLLGAPQHGPDDWARVWMSLQAPKASPAAPPEAHQEGPPLATPSGVLFRFRAPENAERVYLAGSFNAWARNRGGKVTQPSFLMHKGKNNIWWAALRPSPQLHSYKYVVERADGRFQWMADPTVSKKDADGNSVFDFSTLGSWGPKEIVPGLPPVPKPNGVLRRPTGELSTQRVWVTPNTPIRFTYRLPTSAARFPLELVLTDALGRSHGMHSWSSEAKSLNLEEGLSEEGGYLAQLFEGPNLLAETTITVARNIADDLRYGYFTEYKAFGGNYGTRADLLARAHINAVEYYDYFRAHGEYAPTEREYKTDPFGIPIDARDIRAKLEANRSRGILSIAYVAAYAASKSVKDRVPDVMTDERGVPKVFTGSILSEDEAERQGKDKWFWLMNISSGSAWHRHIMEQFASAVDDSESDWVAFDGFEIDSYGDSADTVFYAPGSARHGDLLQNVVRDFVRDCREVTRRIRPEGIVSFNSVNEFAAEVMLPVTDFSFLEIWRGHTDTLEGLTDIALSNRGAEKKRAVLKVYPADMDPVESAWGPEELRRVMGACLTGGASLMVAGEPDPRTRRLRALRTLYYPDHVLMTKEAEAVLTAYNRHDAMLFGLTHGRDVHTVQVEASANQSYVRTFAAPKRKTLVAQVLVHGAEPRWSKPWSSRPEGAVVLKLKVPGGVSPGNILFCSPDVEEWRTPHPIPARRRGEELQVRLPDGIVHGSVLISYE